MVDRLWVIYVFEISKMETRGNNGTSDGKRMWYATINLPI